MHISLVPLCRRVVGWLSEAEVPYAQVVEMEEISSDFSDTDVVNPAVRTDTASPIYGMPILEMHKAGTVLVVKRSMAAGYAGLDNGLFYLDKTMMVFGDAQNVVEEVIKAKAH